jgi:hypothetical protein
MSFMYFISTGRRNLVLAFRLFMRHNSTMPDSKPKVTFGPFPMKNGKGWYVRVMLPHGPQPRIEGFNRKAEAIAWIEHESGEWLKRFEGGKYA